MGWLLVGWTVALAAPACGDARDAPPAAAAPSPNAAAQSETAWRFRPTLDQHVPAGAVAEPVLELSEPRQRSVLILAAVLRSGAEHVEIERWTFEQNPEDPETLQLRTEGQPVLRLRPGPRHPELDDVRRRVAAPRVVLTRPLGLDAPGPAEALRLVAHALATMGEPTAAARDRVAATATVLRGLDDAVVLERDAIGTLATVLVPAPDAIAVQEASPRRATATFVADGRTITVGMHRTSDGWALVSVDGV